MLNFSATNLSVVDHGPHHALGKVEAGQILLRDFAPPSAHFDGALNVLVLSGEGALALLLVQPKVIPVSLVVEGPRIALGSIGDQYRLVGGTVETGIAIEVGAEFAQTSPCWQHFLDEAW